MTKPTRKPVHDDPVSSHIIIHRFRDFEKKFRSLNDVTVCIQCFTLMFLFVGTKDPGEAISFLLGLGKFDAELLGNDLEISYSFV